MNDMTNPTGENLDVTKGGHVCYHLLESDDYDQVRQFTGVGTAYNLLCTSCAQNMDNLAEILREVLEDQFKDIEGYCESVIGQPQIFERASDLSFDHQIVRLEQPFQTPILSIKPERGVQLPRWIAVIASGHILQIDFSDGTVKQLVEIPETALQLTEPVALHLSHDNRFAAVVNNREPLGVVIDLSTGIVTMKLNRGGYHPEQTPFPVAFFESDNKVLLIHGTAWNRLDISEALTGQLLTDRESPRYEQSKPLPEHYLDYFHALPVISPDAEWVVEDGWVWHPVGASRKWNLRRWSNENVWESEDGASLTYLTWRAYHWNAPLCWIDNKTIAIWGFGDDDLAMTPAVQLFDAETGQHLRWFAGPEKGDLYFDDYLFSTSSKGTDVWDIDTGERLLHEPDLTPINYHPDTRQFLSLLPDGTFRLSQLKTGDT
jgi:hypothetical protein